VADGEENVVIIGNGSAGVECIKSQRKNGYKGKIHAMTDSEWPAYNPMLTTYFVADKIGFSQLFPYGSGKGYLSEYAVSLISGSPVVSLDAEQKVVMNGEGLRLKYDQCLIASGASPVLPTVPGIDSANVFVMRTVDDAIKLKTKMDCKPQKALVVGASMVGIKLVELFYKAGMEVCLADMAEHLFPLAAHPACAAIMEERLCRQGIRLRFRSCLDELVEYPGGLEARFADGSPSEKADLVCICVGVRANIGFINKSQVACKNGILVDERMQSSVPGLYAAGDAAQGKNRLTGVPQIIGLWANARYQGRTAGKNMAGGYDAIPGSIPQNITHFMGMDFVGIGDVMNYDATKSINDKNRHIQSFWRDGRLQGVNILDDIGSPGVLRSAMYKGLKRRDQLLQHFSNGQHLLIEEILKEVMGK